jgi:hypothetical protein
VAFGAYPHFRELLSRLWPTKGASHEDRVGDDGNQVDFETSQAMKESPNGHPSGEELEDDGLQEVGDDGNPKGRYVANQVGPDGDMTVFVESVEMSDPNEKFERDLDMLLNNRSSIGFSDIETLFKDNSEIFYSNPEISSEYLSKALNAFKAHANHIVSYCQEVDMRESEPVIDNIAQDIIRDKGLRLLFMLALKNEISAQNLQMQKRKNEILQEISKKIKILDVNYY